jgi:curved DNA-binding protein CbpA
MERQHNAPTGAFLTDHYATLGVPRNADAVRIRDAYRALVRHHHPDLHPDDRDAEDALKRINEAYDVLSDPDKRRQYNLFGTEWEDILREQAELRRAAGGTAPNPPPSTRPSERSTARADPTEASISVALARSAPLVVLALVLLGIGVASELPRRQPPDVTEERARMNQLQEAGGGVRLLRGTLAQFRDDVLEDGLARWSELCASRGAKAKADYERRYAEKAKGVAKLIDRADADGFFALPFALRDHRVLRDLLPLRTQLEQQAATGDVLRCTDSDQALQELTRLVTRVEHCLYRLALEDARIVRAHARLGNGICR